ncbi:MAG: hypothetical protein Q8R00_04820 [Candidatus Nanoarchaeia archaeon]|nr:hypothetical protein [Candidatus Nanoarchaeia archaeon]
MKKGQTETMGLMVIVILIIFLATIFLSFALREKPDLTSEVRESVQTNSLLTSLLQTTIQGKPLKEQFPNCYNNRITCDNLKKQIETMLSLVVPIGQNYQFILLVDEEELINIGACRTGSIAITSIRRDNIDFLARLKLC